MDLTKEWFAVVRKLREHSGLSIGKGGELTAAAAAEAVDGSRWRALLTPFMQQATELNLSIQEMHSFLLEHFLDYVDPFDSLPSKKSLMTEEEKDMIDLEATSFMTACAAGVDALKALLQRERLRRMEQEAAAARVVEEDGVEGDDGMLEAAGGELLPGSRPAHEHAAVTFLFERLKAVTEVAETMQSERHQRVAAKRARFYGGPAANRRQTTDGGRGGNGGSVLDANTRPATKDTWWKPTAEELEEERLLEEMLPGAYGKGPEPEEAVNHDASSGDDKDSDALPAQSSSAGTLSQRRDSGATLADGDGSEGRAVAIAATGDERRERRPPHEDRRSRAPGGPSSVVSAVGSVLQWRGGERGKASAAAAAAAMADEETEESAVVSAEILEGENRDLVARLENELDEARQVETKMTEISGLMGLFASKVLEQQGGIEHVFDAAVSTNDNLVRGGKHLEKAVKRGSAFRRFYAWFMLVASFCLLFLHFFNP